MLQLGKRHTREGALVYLAIPQVLEGRVPYKVIAHVTEQ